jgi:hypothetical protein
MHLPVFADGGLTGCGEITGSNCDKPLFDQRHSGLAEAPSHKPAGLLLGWLPLGPSNSLRPVIARARAVHCVVFLPNSRANGCKKDGLWPLPIRTQQPRQRAAEGLQLGTHLKKYTRYFHV